MYVIKRICNHIFWTRLNKFVFTITYVTFILKIVKNNINKSAYWHTSFFIKIKEGNMISYSLCVRSCTHRTSKNIWNFPKNFVDGIPNFQKENVFFHITENFSIAQEKQSFWCNRNIFKVHVKFSNKLHWKKWLVELTTSVCKTFHGYFIS